MTVLSDGPAVHSVFVYLGNKSERSRSYGFMQVQGYFMFAANLSSRQKHFVTSGTTDDILESFAKMLQ